MQKFVTIGATHILGLSLALTSVEALARVDHHDDSQVESTRSAIARHPVRTTIGAGALIAGAFALHRVVRSNPAPEAPMRSAAEIQAELDKTLKPETPEQLARDAEAQRRFEEGNATTAVVEDATAAVSLDVPADVANGNELGTVDEEVPMTAAEIATVVAEAAQNSGPSQIFELPSSLGEIKQDGYVLKAGTEVPVKMTEVDSGREYAIVKNPQQPGGLLRVLISPKMTHDTHIGAYESVFALKELTPERLAELDPTAIIDEAKANSVTQP